jgi:hypothetical protein
MMKKMSQRREMQRLRLGYTQKVSGIFNDLMILANLVMDNRIFSAHVS